MQYTITINQTKALEWGLNAQQALLFAFVYGCPSWAQPMGRDGEVFYALSKAKIAEELPLLTDKPDTAYRMLRALAAAGLIDLSSTASITLVRLTAKGMEWNRKRDGSEKYPTSEKNPSKGRKKIRSTSEKNPSRVGKISDTGSEKSPTNQDTSNQDTNQDTSHILPALIEPPVVTPISKARKPASDDHSQEACRAIWSAYSAAYEARWKTRPIRNAKVNTQVRDLHKRLGAEAPAVAEYFVSINDAFLVRNCHDFGSLLAKAESFRTQWATNSQMNSTTARQIEQTQANVNAAQQAAERIREKGGARNAFL